MRRSIYPSFFLPLFQPTFFAKPNQHVVFFFYSLFVLFIIAASFSPPFKVVTFFQFLFSEFQQSRLLLFPVFVSSTWSTFHHMERAKFVTFLLHWHNHFLFMRLTCIETAHGSVTSEINWRCILSWIPIE